MVNYSVEDNIVEGGAIVLHRKIRAGIWIPLVLVVAFLAGYTVWNFSQKPGVYDDQIIQNQEFRIKNQANEVEGWQTYRNEEYGFEFKYPAEFNELFGFEINVNDYKVIEPGPGAFYMRLAKDTWQSRLSHQESYQEGDVCFREEQGEYDVECNVFSKQPFSFKSISLYGNENEHRKAIYLILPTKEAEISIFIPQLINDRILRQILSTFKFIE